MRNFLIILCFICIASCSFKKGALYNQKKDGHWALYSLPKEESIINFNSTTTKRLLVVSLNDLFFSINSGQELKKLKNGDKIFNVGGFDLLKKYLEILKKKYNQEILIIDAGNSLASFEIKDAKAYRQLINEYKKLGVSSISLGDSDFKIKNLKNIISNDKLFINSNVFDLKSGKLMWEDSISHYKIVEVNDLKVGIISVVSPEKFKQLSPTVTNGLYAQPMEFSLIKMSRRLKKLGANIIVATVQAEQDCGSELAKELSLPLSKVNFDTKEIHCKKENDLSQLLKKLPKSTLDLVINTGTSNKIANYINTNPVVRNTGFGKYFSITELYFNLKNNSLEKEKTILHQPIKICAQFLKTTQDCYLKDNSVDQGEVIKAKFLGVEI